MTVSPPPQETVARLGGRLQGGAGYIRSTKQGDKAYLAIALLFTMGTCQVGVTLSRLLPTFGTA